MAWGRGQASDSPEDVDSVADQIGSPIVVVSSQNTEVFTWE